MIYYTSYSTENEKEYILSHYTNSGSFKIIRYSDDDLSNKYVNIIIDLHVFIDMRKHIKYKHTVCFIFFYGDIIKFHSYKRMLVRKGLKLVSLTDNNKTLRGYSNNNQLNIEFIEEKKKCRSLLKNSRVLTFRIGYLRSVGS